MLYTSSAFVILASILLPYVIFLLAGLTGGDPRRLRSIKMVTDVWEHNSPINVAMLLTNLIMYNEQNIKNWFLQLEVIFSVQRIRSQQSKFINVVQVLSPSVVNKVADILENVPKQEPYTRLKDPILKCTGRSDKDLLRGTFHPRHQGWQKTLTAPTLHQKPTGENIWWLNWSCANCGWTSYSPQ